jgi:RNA polymerase sigma-70 factor (ECF subfamily)
VRTDDFAEFYTTSFARVARAVRAFCGNADVAHEATQEAFARAFSRWPKVKEVAWPEAWVTTTAMNVSKRHFRRRSRQRATAPGESSAGPSGDRVDVLAALRLLPERQRQATVLHYLLDCPVGAVAELMGLSDGAVKAHLHKARATLRNSLEVRHA